MRYRIFKQSLALAITIFSLQISAQNITSLARGIPEAGGVSSEGILNFVAAADSGRHEFHSFMFLRHGKVIAGGWWSPYRPDLRHSLYSLSKSFTSTAVGFAVTEKLLSVDDKVISFFPDLLPDTVSQNLKDLTVKDLLTMSVGQDHDPTGSIRNWDADWVKSFLALPIKYKPGTKFLYNSAATFMLSAIVQKVTGQKVIDYLKPRLFAPLGIEGMDWEVSPKNINTGGWGLRLKTEDLAKFGQFYLQKGKWNNKQLLPEKWINEATTIKIEQDPGASQAKKDSSDWLQGYGYQFWLCRNNTFRGDGAFGQFVIVMPDQDAVVVITAETSDMQGELNLVWKYLLPSIQKNQLPANPMMVDKLKKRLASLALPIPVNNIVSQWPGRISGKRYTLEPNSKHINSIEFLFGEKKCEVSMKADSASYKLAFGNGRLIPGETGKRGPSLLSNDRSDISGLLPFKVAGSFMWQDENTLELTLRYIESPHSEKYICRFDGNNISIETRGSIDPKNKIIVLKGELDNPKN